MHGVEYLTNLFEIECGWTLRFWTGNFDAFRVVTRTFSAVENAPVADGAFDMVTSFVEPLIELIE